MKITTKLTVFAALVTLIAVAGCQNPLEPSSSGYSVSDQPDYRYTNDRLDNEGEAEWYPDINIEDIRYYDGNASIRDNLIHVAFPIDKNLDILHITDKAAFDAQLMNTIEFWNLNQITATRAAEEWGAYSTKGSRIAIVPGSIVQDGVNVWFKLTSTSITSSRIVAVVKADYYLADNGRKLDRNGDGVLDRLGQDGYNYDDQLTVLPTGLSNTAGYTIVDPDNSSSWGISLWLNVNETDYVDSVQVLTNVAHAYIGGVFGDPADGPSALIDPNSANYAGIFNDNVVVERLDPASNTWSVQGGSWDWQVGTERYVMTFTPVAETAYRLVVRNPANLKSSYYKGFEQYSTYINGYQETQYARGRVVYGPEVRWTKLNNDVEVARDQMFVNPVFYAANSAGDFKNNDDRAKLVFDIAQGYQFTNVNVANMRVVRADASATDVDWNNPEFVEFTAAVRDDPAVMTQSEFDYLHESQLVITFNRHKPLEGDKFFLVFLGNIQANHYTRKGNELTPSWHAEYLGDFDRYEDDSDAASSLFPVAYKGYKVQASSMAVALPDVGSADWWTLVAAGLETFMNDNGDNMWDYVGMSFINGYNNSVSDADKLSNDQQVAFYSHYTGSNLSAVISRIESGDVPTL